jgi:predicted nucleotidyltransferase
MDLPRIDSYFEALVRHFRERLGAELVSVHKIGSLAHGGFSPEFSDLDLALVLGAEPDPGEMENAIADARAIDPELGSRLSVFWSNRSFEFGRFPILDQADLIEHGVCIYGPPLGALAEPALAEVREYLLGGPLSYWQEKTERFSNDRPIPKKEQKEYLRCLMYPARLLYTWDTGRLASNDAALRHLQERDPVPGLRVELVERALACRNAQASFESLLPERGALRAQLEATLAAIGRGATP